MKKKSILVLLLALMLCFSLAACGGSSDTTGGDSGTEQTQEDPALKEAADADLEAKVKAEVNGYYWMFDANNMYYELEFYEPDEFEIRCSNAGGTITNNGTYTVQKGYIFLYYPGDTEPSVEVPFTFEDGEFELDPATGFDVMSD